MRFGFTGLAAFALFGLLGCSREDGVLSQPKPGDETGFVTASASGGMLEVKLGQYAAENAQSEQVRDFARKMVDDHARANQSLEIAAQGQDLKLPDAMLKPHEDAYEELTKLSGAKFDWAYAHAMVEGHEQTAAAMRAEIARAPQTQVGQWASATLPTVEAHLVRARSLVAEIPLASIQ